MRVLLQNKLFAIANFLAVLFVIVSGKTVVNAAIFLLVFITVSKYRWPLAKNYGKIVFIYQERDYQTIVN